MWRWLRSSSPSLRMMTSALPICVTPRHTGRRLGLRADIVVNNLTGTAFTQGSVRLQSDGSPWRPLVHVEDISRAFLALLEAPRDVVHDQAFNVGRDEDVVQIRTIAEQVSDITGAPVSFAEGAGPDTRNYQVDFTKIRSQVPAFDPQWTVPQGIEEIWKDAGERGLTNGGLRRPSLCAIAPNSAAGRGRSPGPEGPAAALSHGHGASRMPAAGAPTSTGHSLCPSFSSRFHPAATATDVFIPQATGNAARSTVTTAGRRPWTTIRLAPGRFARPSCGRTHSPRTESTSLRRPRLRDTTSAEKALANPKCDPPAHQWRLMDGSCQSPSGGAAPGQYRRHRLPQDQQIEGQRPVFDIAKVEADGVVAF